VRIRDIRLIQTKFLFIFFLKSLGFDKDFRILARMKRKEIQGYEMPNSNDLCLQIRSVVTYCSLNLKINKTKTNV
jgi:hypothetical protein